MDHLQLIKNHDLALKTDVPVRYIVLPKDNYGDNPFTGNNNGSN